VTGGGSSGGKPRLEVLHAEDVHAAEIAEFIRCVWDPKATPESVVSSPANATEQTVAEPGVPPPIWMSARRLTSEPT
jgi:hypothetical protein